MVPVKMQCTIIVQNNINLGTNITTKYSSSPRCRGTALPASDEHCRRRTASPRRSRRVGAKHRCRAPTVAVLCSFPFHLRSASAHLSPSASLSPFCRALLLPLLCPALPRSRASLPPVRSPPPRCVPSFPLSALLLFSLFRAGAHFAGALDGRRSMVPCALSFPSALPSLSLSLSSVLSLALVLFSLVDRRMGNEGADARTWPKPRCSNQSGCAAKSLEPMRLRHV